MIYLSVSYASGGLEVKLRLTFKGAGEIVYKMKQLIRKAYTWDYTVEQPQINIPDPLNEDEE